MTSFLTVLGVVVVVVLVVGAALWRLGQIATAVGLDDGTDDAREPKPSEVAPS